MRADCPANRRTPITRSSKEEADIVCQGGASRIPSGQTRSPSGIAVIIRAGGSTRDRLAHPRCRFSYRRECGPRGIFRSAGGVQCAASRVPVAAGPLNPKPVGAPAARCYFCVMAASPHVDIYDTVWTSAEIVGRGGSVKRLQRHPALFRTRQGPTELPAHGGPLSIKMVRSGATHYGFGRQSYCVTPGRMLLVCAGDIYSTRVDRVADIVTAYLPKDHVEIAAAVLAKPGHIPHDGVAIEFAAHLRNDDRRMCRTLEALTEERDPERHREKLLTIAGIAAALALDAVDATWRTGAAKPSVRRELFRRASVARAVLEAAPHEAVALDQLAVHAALSPFHLLRTFCTAFGETPAQMRRRLCLDRAITLLSTRRLSVAEVALAVGFEDQSAFSRSFRRRMGMTPSAFRARARSGLLGRPP